MSGPVPVKSSPARQHPTAKKTIVVKSRYLNIPAKMSEKSNNSSNSNSTKLGKGSKTSTPTKDTSLFRADISVVSHAQPSVVKEKLVENIAEEVFRISNMDKLLKAIHVIVKEEKAAFAASADIQLSVQRKLVGESVCTLSNVHKQVDVVCTTNEIEAELAFLESCIDEILADSALRDVESFNNISNELEKARSKLICKNVRLPRNQEDYDEIVEAARKLVEKLKVIETLGKDKMRDTSKVKRAVCAIETTCNKLRESTESAKQVMPAITTIVLEEISTKMMNAGLSNFPVEF